MRVIISSIIHVRTWGPREARRPAKVAEVLGNRPSTPGGVREDLPPLDWPTPPSKTWDTKTAVRSRWCRGRTRAGCIRGARASAPWDFSCLLQRYRWTLRSSHLCFVFSFFPHGCSHQSGAQRALRISLRPLSLADDISCPSHSLFSSLWQCWL